MHGVTNITKLYLHAWNLEESTSHFLQRLPRILTVAKGNTAEFTCSVAPDNAKVTWCIDGIPIYESTKYKLEVAGAERKLLIHHSNRLDEGLVTATTGHDETSTDFCVEGVFRMKLGSFPFQ